MLRETQTEEQAEEFDDALAGTEDTSEPDFDARRLQMLAMGGEVIVG